MKVGIVGATNVGKSTLFNRLIGQFRAIVTNKHGTTRDILEHVYRKFSLGDLFFYDTPGLDTFDEEIPFIKRVVGLSDLIIFVIDQKIGFGAKEQEIHKIIAQSGNLKKTILVVNKFDSEKLRDEFVYSSALTDYYGLGYSNIVPTSAKNGTNIKELRSHIYNYFAKIFGKNEKFDIDEYEIGDEVELNEDLIIDEESDVDLNEEDLDEEDGFDSEYEEDLDDDIEEDFVDDNDLDDALDEKETIIRHDLDKVEKPERIRIAIVGKPNSGKSTLMNFLSNEAISKVSDIPGTTLDYTISTVKFQGKQYDIYDTAGIRKKGKIHGLEYIAYQKTKDMLRYLKPVVLFLIDVSVDISHRDLSLYQEITQMGLPVVIGLNKTDLLDKTELAKVRNDMRIKFNFAKQIENINISAKTGKGVSVILNKLEKARDNSFQIFKTNSLNKLVSKAYIQNPPKFNKNKICKIYYLTQTGVHPISFSVFVNHVSRANFSFKRRLENVIRSKFDLSGCNFFLDFKSRKENKE